MCFAVIQTKGNTGTKHGSVEELVEKADGFAEVFPEHKFEIVEILQVRSNLKFEKRFCAAVQPLCGTRTEG